MKPTGLLLVFFLITSPDVFAQFRPSQLHLQKNGRVKKRIQPGTIIRIEDKEKYNFRGTITYMKTDTIVLDGKAVIPISTIHNIKLPNNRPRKPINWEELGWVTFGVAISTLGMGLSRAESWPAAAAISVVLGYSPYLFRQIKKISFKKYRYRIGGKYQLRVWDLN